MEIIEDIKKRIIGLTCSNAKIGYADVLKLSFGGELFNKTSKLENKLCAKIEISIETFSWRLTNDTIIECGSSDNYKNAENGLKKIFGKKVISIIAESNNIQIVLDNNYTLEAFKSTVENDDLIFIDIEKEGLKKNYVFNGAKWRNYTNPGLSKSEVELNEFSKITDNRWKTKTLITTSENHCKNCSCFLELSGRFYFWDYGVCANGSSENDGKMVNVKSSCENYSTKINH